MKTIKRSIARAELHFSRHSLVICAKCRPGCSTKEAPSPGTAPRHESHAELSTEQWLLNENVIKWNTAWLRTGFPVKMDYGHPKYFWVSWVPRINQALFHTTTHGTPSCSYWLSSCVTKTGQWNASESSSCSPEAKKTTKWVMDVKNPWQRFRDDWCQYPSAYSIYI